MKATLKGNLIRRLGALALCALLAFGPLGGLVSARAEMPALPISISLTWNNLAGFSAASPIQAPGYENSFWLYAPQDAVEADARLTIADGTGQYARFALMTGAEVPAEGLPLSQLGYLDAGLEPGMNYMEITAFDALGQMAATLRLYISTQAAAPTLPNTEPEPQIPQITQAPVAVRYINAMTGQVIAEATVTVTVENGWVNADDNLAPGMERMSEPSAYVTVNPDGSCSPNPVEFHYRPAVQAATVEVVCLDDGGNVLSSMQETHQPGVSLVYAPAFEGLTLSPDSSAQVEINVTAEGASPARVEFRYVRPVNPVAVTVKYVDETGNVFNSFPQECKAGVTTIFAQPVEGYDLDANYPGQVDVNVTAEGANAQEVVFHYVRKINAVTVTVKYVDETGNVFNSFPQECKAGVTTISAQPVEGYDIDPNYLGQVDVNVTADGANVQEVIFHYVRKINAVTVTVKYVDETGNVFNSFPQECKAGVTSIFAQPVEGYDLDPNYPGQVDVNVTAEGANVQEVVFHYVRKINAVNVTVKYVDETGNVFNSFPQECPAGASTIYAQNAEGYDLDANYPDHIDVTVTADGASISEAVFHYVRQVRDVNVPVYYRNVEGGNVAEPSAWQCKPGENKVSALPVAGYAPDEQVKTVTVTADGAVPAEVVFIYTLLPVATETPVPATETPVPATETPVPATDTPAPTAAVVQTVVPVRYVDQFGQELVRTEETVSTGENLVQVNSDLISATYSRYGDASVRVVVDEQGRCTPEQVVFTFIGPVDITVYYRDYQENNVASPQTVRCVPGVNPITPKPDDLLEGFALADSNLKYVTVDQNGADVKEIVFHYGVQVENPSGPTATPEPRLALVTVEYRTTTGENPFYVDSTVKCFTGENTVTANDSFVPEGYKPEGSTTAQVTVDQNGVASPDTVVFLYNVSDMTRSVMVYYRDGAGKDVAEPQSVAIKVGNRQINADPDRVPAGWQIAGESVQPVRLDENGMLTPEYIVFTLQEIPATPKPAPQDYPVYDMDAYCYPKADGTPVRSTPEDGEDNAIGAANQRDVTHIEGYVLNSKNETWYVVTAGDQTGFVRDSQVRVLSQAEVDALFGTPKPVTPTPIPETPIPDGAFIDRWGSLNADSVNFRTDTSVRSESLGRYGKNQKIFIYDSITVNDEKWYRANLNGRDGFMMAKYIDLMSASDSTAYQQSLSTPMPVRTLVPTEPPATPTPTPVPVTATPTQSPTPTPPAYTGYAITVRAVDLRTGVTLSDTTLSTLSANTLLYLYGQAYVNGVCWNSAEALVNHASGYVQDDALRRISAEEAAPYLAALQPKTPTPAPTIRPDPYSGYAVTKGGNVMVRNYADEKAEIAQVLSEGEVVWVMSQEYVAGSSCYWEVVQAGKVFGYVRSDQLRMMEPAEQAIYEQNLRTPVPTVEYLVTPVPVTQSSMSSYGYVTTNNVRLRSAAGTQSTQIRMMNQYAFALVLGTEVVNGQTWYHINQSGMEGYVMGDYFKVLSLGELSEFLTSDAYRQAAANTAETTDVSAPANTGSGITSVEDFNSGVWKNPSLVNVTYEPFSNIIATPTPDVEQVPTVSLAPTATPTATPTASPVPVATTGLTEFTTPVPNTSGGGSGWLWAGLAAAAVLAGGGAYGYSIYRANQRRAAQRAAQRRKQQQQAQASPYARPTTQQAQQTQQVQRAQYPTAPASGQQTTVFTPPRPQAASQQPDATRRVPTQSAPTSPSASGNNAPQQPATPPRRRRSDKHQS